MQQRETVLFQGDSVTDAGRNREDSDNLGYGYSMMAAAIYSAKYPGQSTKFLNRGVGGDRVINLQSRWKKDCLELKPDVISILIGINDTWRKYDSNDPTSPEKFEEGYRDLLTQIRSNLASQIILCEPFLLHVSEEKALYREDLNPKIDVVRSLAREFDCHLLPLDGIFAKVSAYQKPDYWAQDGVHPTMAGHALIALEWIKIVEESKIL